MYWSRTGNILDLILWLVQSSLWWAGGWLLIAHLFRLNARERLLSGMATGLLLFILLSNALAYVLPISGAFWGAAVLILGLGLLAAWRFPLPSRVSLLEDLRAWPQILALGGLLAIFSLINRGLSIFDDYSNLPLVSSLAAGDFPPHLYVNFDQVLDYHYGLHLFAASLMRIGGLFPWSAFDLSKALSTVLTLNLAWLWFRRLTHKNHLVVLGVLLILFGAGTRWLLLFAPETTTRQLGANLGLWGSATDTGPDLFTNLLRPWNIGGDGPFPFPFAFVNGINRPLSMAMGGNGAMPPMTTFLLLLLAQKCWKSWPGLVYGLVLSSLALTGDHLFVMIWAGIFLAALIGSWLERSSRQEARRHLLDWAWVLLPGAILAPCMGGVLTGIARGWLAPLIGVSTASVSFTGASVRWPPAFVSAHLGELSLTNPAQVFSALVEMGPVLLLSPWITWMIVKRIRARRLVIAGLSIGAMIGFLAPLVILLDTADRDMSRVAGAALFTWMVLGYSYLLIALPATRKVVGYLAGAGYAITVLGGLALFPSQVIAISRAQLTFFAQESDALMCKAYWNRLEEGAKIMSIQDPSVPVTILGRGMGHAYLTIDKPFPEFAELLASMDPLQIAKAGYSYVYLTKQDWHDLTPTQKQALQQPCVKELPKPVKQMGELRLLLDVKGCNRSP